MGLGEITIATCEPLDVGWIDEILAHTKKSIRLVVASPLELQRYRTEFYTLAKSVRDANKKGFAQIEKDIGSLGAKARDGKLSIDEMTGGTFTITNGGVFGSLMATPIINPPQSAILGMHKIQERPVAVNGQVVIRPMMYIALSYDHRIIDGKESVSFLVRIKDAIEDPQRLLLDV